MQTVKKLLDREVIYRGTHDPDLEVAIFEHMGRIACPVLRRYTSDLLFDIRCLQARLETWTNRTESSICFFYKVRDCGTHFINAVPHTAWEAALGNTSFTFGREEWYRFVVECDTPRGEPCYCLSIEEVTV